MPRCLGASGSVRTSANIQSARCAFEGPDLLSVDHVVVAVLDRAGLQRGEVGAGTGLGVALAPRRPRVDDVVEELALLTVGAVDEQRRTDVPDRDQVRSGNAVVSQLLVEYRLLGEGEAHAAVLSGPGGSGPALLCQLGPDALGEFPGLVRPLFVVGDIQTVPVLAELVTDPAANLVAPGFLISVEFKVHRASSLLVSYRSQCTCGPADSALLPRELIEDVIGRRCAVLTP